ncbi:succinate dehydrogenase cytochrome b small subunit [Aspergillus taichungensis]|uniref:Succinate dehydrogenase [ubiquinone] cytochrome b small subunit n=1 Tax=Aspergillus taichungensis TaxID=482145 RepID=A0A2J5HP33_9EURO|nr:succinate dehydrogenase cytochrome b small subunit [Aspergillus taichungensis]
MASLARQSPLLRLSAARPLAIRPAGASQMVGFHASAKKQILPPLPQTVQGTVNDPAPIPEAHPSEGSYHWTFERLVAVGLVPLCIAPFAAGSLNPVMDAVLCSGLILHSHIGFQASIIDYFPTRRVPKTHTACNWLLRAFTLGTAVGLYEFETNDVGLTEAIRRVWTA